MEYFTISKKFNNIKIDYEYVIEKYMDLMVWKVEFFNALINKNGNVS